MDTSKEYTPRYYSTGLRGGAWVDLWNSSKITQKYIVELARLEMDARIKRAWGRLKA